MDGAPCTHAGKAHRGLKARLGVQGIPSIYVNDNFGQWRSSLQEQVRHCRAAESCGRLLVQKFEPQTDDYFVLKPKHSGFYGTALEPLLICLQAQTSILAGVAGDRWVLFTANEAYLRDYRIFVPMDCVLSNGPKGESAGLAPEVAQGSPGAFRRSPGASTSAHL
jgi:nicotinamidase-related amidase